MPTWFEKMLNSQYVMVGLAVLAFLVALWLVITIVRMLAGGRLKMPGNRTRQPRLGIVDAYDLDRQRQLIIVRRDNTEHLIMIGGPNDLVIESEIVRMESRDNRRDKAGEFVGGTALAGDARIPAPFTLSDRPEPALGETRSGEPILPLASPVVAPPPPSTMPVSQVDPVSEEPAPPAPPRAPTFPLPPRRPAPLPERRTPPSPPRIPEGATRGDLPLSTASAPQPEPPPSSLTPATGAAPLSPEAGTRPAPRPMQPPFLKPLPPRPPLRPLQRATPQAPTTSEPTPTAAVEAAAPSPAKPTPSPPPIPPAGQDGDGPAPLPEPHLSEAPLIPQPPAPQTLAPPPPPPSETHGEKDALESLEEEMAKLLGRG